MMPAPVPFGIGAFYIFWLKWERYSDRISAPSSFVGAGGDLSSPDDSRLFSCLFRRSKCGILLDTTHFLMHGVMDLWSLLLYDVGYRVCVWRASRCSFSKLILTVDSTDDNYMPKRVTVFGGEGDNLKKMSDVTIDEWASLKIILSVCFTIEYAYTWHNLVHWINFGNIIVTLIIAQFFQSFLLLRQSLAHV